MIKAPLKKRRINKVSVKEESKEFSFSKENQAKIKMILKQYPKGREASAILALFDLAQRQCGGWLPKEAIEKVTGILNLPIIRGYEIATFYTMFNLEPIGKYLVQICGTTPCMLRGSEDLKEVCRKEFKVECGETSKDGLFTLKEVECIGACVNAPVVQINDDYYEDLTKENFRQILEDLKQGKKVKPGSFLGRQGSAPLERRTNAQEE